MPARSMRLRSESPTRLERLYIDRIRPLGADESRNPEAEHFLHGTGQALEAGLEQMADGTGREFWSGGGGAAARQDPARFTDPQNCRLRRPRPRDVRVRPGLLGSIDWTRAQTDAMAAQSNKRCPVHWQRGGKWQHSFGCRFGCAMCELADTSRRVRRCDLRDWVRDAGKGRR